MIKKRIAIAPSSTGIRTIANVDLERVLFSFRFFDHSDSEVCPAKFPDGYTRKLMQRLRDLSSMTVREFTSNRSSSLRIHPIDWDDTCRPNGFQHLNEQYTGYPNYQFSISSNEHGRVHGLLIDATFYLIWLDCSHKLYS